MKQLLRFVAVFGMLAVPAVAGAQVSTGVRVGANLADLAFEPTPPIESKNLVGLVVGAFVTVPVSDMVAFQPEALFSQQGTRFSEAGMTLKTKIDYFQIPLLGRFRLGPRSPLAVLAGPSLGFKTNATFEGTGVPDDFSDDFEDSVKTFDFGLVAGAVLDVGHFVLDGRYTWGLTNLAKPESSSSSDEGSAKNRVFSFSAGVRF